MLDADLLALDNSNFEKLFFERSSSSVFTELDGETVILNIETGIYSGLNELGTVIWNVLEDKMSFVDIREAVLSDFEVPLEECVVDLLSFLQELTKNKLIEVSVGANS